MTGKLLAGCRRILLSAAAVALPLSWSAAGQGAASPEIDQVKTANDAYYAALSARSIPGMERVWAQTERDVNIAPPVHPAAHVGWEAIKSNYRSFWSTLDELTVAMDTPAIEIRGPVAWVYGIEMSHRRDKHGQTSGGPNFGTSIFVKQAGRWRMVYHQAALMPQPH